MVLINMTILFIIITLLVVIGFFWLFFYYLPKKSTEVAKRKKEENKKRGIVSKNKPENSPWDVWMGRANIKYQVENYKNLKIYQSARGVPVLLVLVAMIFLILLAITSMVSIDIGTLFFLIISYLIILPFSYKGHMWAIIVWLIFTVINIIYTIYLLGNFWFSVVMFFYVLQALRVEIERRKKIKLNI